MRPALRLPVLRALLVLLVLAPVPAAFGQRTYHFNPAGDDAAGDGSAARPWASLARANALDLAPGDSVLLAGGATFRGQIALDAADAGTPARPVVVGSYGQGRARVEAPTDGYGLLAYNAAGLTVERLVLVGSGGPAHPKDGILFYTDLPGNVKLPHVRIDSVDVSGFGNGVVVGAWNGRTGYDDVRVTRSHFHHNVNGGSTYGEAIGALTNVYVGRCRFYENAGKAGHNGPTGSGFVFGQVAGGVVEYTAAYGNGALNTSSAGPVGLWAYESDRVVFQFNEAWDNRTGPGGGDGGGFDLDGGVTNSVVQYNYSHDNDGAGFGIFQYAGASAYGGNVVRYNVSENDGRKNGYGAITVWGATPGDLVRGTDVYQNTVYGRAPAVVFLNGHHRGLTFRNNVFVTVGGSPVVRAPEPADVRFEGNAYWSGSDAFALAWGPATYNDLAPWRTAAGQERLAGSDVGLRADPLLTAPGTGGTVGDPERLSTLAGYRLRAASPVADAALDLREAFGLDPGSRDFYGAPLGQGSGRAVGSAEPGEGSFPVELDGFQALADGDRVRLLWTTASETRNAGWEVEMRAAAGTPTGPGDAPWRGVAFVAGHGTTAERHTYARDVPAPAPGRYAFRLRQVDDDGTANYSPVVEVDVALGAPLSLGVTLQSVRFAVRERQAVEVALFDALGRRVAVLFEGDAAPGAETVVALPAGGLAAGVYFVRLRGERGVLVRSVVR